MTCHYRQPTSFKKPLIHTVTTMAFLLCLQTNADTGTIATATDLKSAPDAGAATVLQLPVGSTVQVGERKGAWYKVSGTQGDGWVRMLAVRLGSGARAQGASASSGFEALSAASRSNTTVATGIRGMSREQISHAQEDLREVAQLDQYRVSPQEAQTFGVSAGLPAPGAH